MLRLIAYVWLCWQEPHAMREIMLMQKRVLAEMGIRASWLRRRLALGAYALDVMRVGVIGKPRPTDVRVVNAFLQMAMTYADMVKTANAPSSDVGLQ